MRNYFRKKKKLLLQKILLNKLMLKFKILKIRKKCFLKIGKIVYLECRKEIKHYRH